MTAVIYARYSSDSQREASIEGQLRDCKDYAEKNGITVVGTYIDRAYSAKTDDRPDFQRMIKDSAKKIFDVVLVWKLDRFARNRYDAVNYKYQLEKNGVHLLAVPAGLQVTFADEDAALADCYAAAGPARCRLFRNCDGYNPICYGLNVHIPFEYLVANKIQTH